MSANKRVSPNTQDIADVPKSVDIDDLTHGEAITRQLTDEGVRVFCNLTVCQTNDEVMALNGLAYLLSLDANNDKGYWQAVAALSEFAHQEMFDDYGLEVLELIDVIEAYALKKERTLSEPDCSE